MTNEKPSAARRHQSSLLTIADKVDRFVDARLPQSPEAVRRRKITVRSLGASTALAVTVGVAGATIPIEQGLTTTTVQTGDSYEGAVKRGQEAIAQKNPSVDPSNPAYIPAAAELQHEFMVGPGRQTQAGDQIDVRVTNTFFGNHQDTTAGIHR
jgi:hypothetical protein